MIKGFLRKLKKYILLILKLPICFCNEFGDSESSHGSDFSMSRDDIDYVYSFDDRVYAVQQYHVTTNFFNEVDIGKFVTDIDGLLIYLNKKTADFIGKPRKKIRVTAIWQYNLFTEDLSKVFNKWHIAINDQSYILHKERRLVNNKIAYLIFEAYRIESRGIFKGFKGIILRTTKPIWMKFDEDYVINKYMIPVFINKNYQENIIDNNTIHENKVIVV